MVIKVHIACDDPSYRDAISTLLEGDDDIEVIVTSREAEYGVDALKDANPDVVVLAVPPAEDVVAHAQMYKSAASKPTGFVGFCILDVQAQGYLDTRIEQVVFPSDTASVLRDAIKAAYKG